MFYEVIYENGEYSVMNADTDEEVIGAIKIHHARAVLGQVGGPSGHKAQRIVRVLKYDNHPVDLNESQAMNVEDVRAAIDTALDTKSHGGLISIPELGAIVRELSSPVIVDSAPHETNYKMQEVGELSGWAE